MAENNSDNDVSQKSGSTHRMTEDRDRAVNCVFCEDRGEYCSVCDRGEKQ